MEWTKENTERTYIVCRSAVAYGKAIEFYEKIGYTLPIGTSKYMSKGKNIFYFVGVLGVFINVVSYKNGIVYASKEIKPFYKPRLKFPRKMMVSIDKINWHERTVFGKIKTEYPYIADASMQGLDTGYIVTSWKYAKEIN